MTHLELCSGIGGFHLAAEWAGLETVGFSEVEPYCCKVLKQKWPHIKNYGDLRTADFLEWRGRIDVLSAGVPCQPASFAGKRRGSKDDRWLWEAVLDVVGGVQPAWLLLENPVGILSLGEFGGVLLRLESFGYEVRAFSVPANAVGAKHRRERVFIVAHAGARRERDGFMHSGATQGIQEWSERQTLFSEPSGVSRTSSEIVADTELWELQRWGGSGELGSATAEEFGEAQQRQRTGDATSNSGEALADADRSWQLQQGGIIGEFGERTGDSSKTRSTEFRLTQPPLCGRADGIPNRSHRLKALGNAVVPQQAYPFFKAIYETEKASCAVRS